MAIEPLSLPHNFNQSLTYWCDNNCQNNSHGLQQKGIIKCNWDHQNCVGSRHRQPGCVYAGRKEKCHIHENIWQASMLLLQSTFTRHYWDKRAYAQTQIQYKLLLTIKLLQLHSCLGLWKYCVALKRICCLSGSKCPPWWKFSYWSRKEMN